MALALRPPAAHLRCVFGVLLLTLISASLAAQTNYNNVLNATSGKVTVLNAAPLDFSPQLTIEAWLKPEPVADSYAAVVDKDRPYGLTFGVAAIVGRTDSVALTVGWPEGWAGGPRIASDSLTWTHVAVTIDTVAGVVVYYVNGIMASTLTGTKVRFSKNTSSLRFGRSPVGDLYRGMCDEIRLWNVVRSEAEINSLWKYEAKGNEPGLVAVYHFEDSRDTIAWNRASGGGLDGTISAPGSIVAQLWPSAFTDENEFNGNFLNATPLNYRSTVLNAAVAPGDTDIYKIYTKPGDIVRIATSAKNTGDLVNLLISFVGSDSTKHITTYVGNFPWFYSAATAPGYHYIRVRINSGSGGPYILQTTREGSIQADSCEPNNTQAMASPVQWGSLTNATIFPGLDAGIASPDTDFYSFEGLENEIGVLLEFVDGLSIGSTRLSLHGMSGILTNSFPTSFSGAVANIRFPSTGTYFARVVPNEAACYYALGVYKGLADINGMLFDPCTYSDRTYLFDGWSDAYDGAYMLKINNAWYNMLPDYSLSECDGRQFCFKPQTIGGLAVSRKFFVPTAAQGDTLGFMRIQEILTNPTTSPIDVNVIVSSNFGAGSGMRYLATSSGDTVWQKSDSWLLTDDNMTPGGDPALSHIYDGTGGEDRIDSVWSSQDQLQWEWRNVTVRPGETKIYMYFVAQDTLITQAQKKGPAFSGAALPAAAKLGLNADAFNVKNWLSSALVSTESEPSVPLIFSLGQNFPNPFNPRTLIRAEWPLVSDVTLAVFDLLGRKVATLANGRFPAGRFEFAFDASRLASGVYLYRLETRAESGVRVDVKKMVLLK